MVGADIGQSINFPVLNLPASSMRKLPMVRQSSDAAGTQP